MDRGIPLGMNDRTMKLDTREKALDINLDASRYGTFAEIGAGQEVVRWFFGVGGAAGTIAKSMSAYDMSVSDQIYGAAKRYVSRERLEAMLEHEHQLNRSRLDKERGETTAFFAFADTVAARSFKGDNECHGWMGIRFQAGPREPDSQIVIHIRMLDNEARRQYEALGIVGVNLVYAACRLAQDPDAVVTSLLDGLSPARVEIDMIDFSGAQFAQVDNRIFTLKLVQLGYTGAAMFTADGRSVQPAEALYKKAALIQRGGFRPPTLMNQDMQRCALEAFARDLEPTGREIVPLLEISLASLAGEGGVDLQDFLARAEMLEAAGHIVLLTEHAEHHRLAASIARLTSAELGLVLRADALEGLFDEARYAALDGGILEAFALLFRTRAKLYVYPFRDAETGSLLTARTLKLTPQAQGLYDFLEARGSLTDLEGYNESCLGLSSRDALQRIRAGDPSWQQMLPEPVVELIKQRALLGYR